MLRLNGYNSEKAGFMAMFAAVPQLFVGWVLEFQKGSMTLFWEERFDDGPAWRTSTLALPAENGCGSRDAESAV